jgi:imidazolonepropionase
MSQEKTKVMGTVPITWDRIWIGADLATMDEAGGIGHVPDAALAIRDGRIAWLGTRQQLQAISWSANVETDARGLWITPGLIECHTHLVYAGDRSNEFAARLRGATYEDIARAGGGIVSTMRATRAASEDDLLAQSLPRAQALASEGVTTLEVKSGYGLDLASELKMLRVAQRLGHRLGIDVIKTFLGAHALPPEFADAADVFCERIAFTREQTGRVFEQASKHGLKLRLHADQLSDGGGGELAARYGALSADHLEFASAASLQLMARKGVIAGLLPGAFYYLREQQLPPIDRMRELGVQMAVSTDCNPGTSPIASLLLAMNMACVLFRMTAAEVLRGVTVNAARALGLGEDRGMLRAGLRADLAIWKLRHPEQLCAEVGTHRPVEIIKTTR